MSETTSAIVQGGAIGFLFLFMAFSIRYLARELQEVRRQLQDLENALLKQAGLPIVRQVHAEGSEGEPFN